MVGKKAFDVDVALERAMVMFWCKGYEASSLPDLLAAMEIGRQSLYDTFGTKHDLYMAALKLYCEVHAAALLEPVEAPDALLDDVRRYLESNVASYFAEPGARSCFMVNSTLELAMRNREVARYVAGFRKRIESALANAVSNAARKGELQTEEAPRAIVRRLMTFTLGLPVYVRGGASRRAAKEAIRATIASLRG